MSSVTCYCPKCDDKMQIVFKYGGKEKGKFMSCTKCDYSTRYASGSQQYKNFRHDMSSKKK